MLAGLPKAGKRLANGAIVLNYDFAGNYPNDRTYVLALSENAGHPFVTWRFHNKTGDTMHGQYFETLGEASASLRERAI